jgi:hypothetical protein
MSWSLEVFSSQPNQVTIAELAAKLSSNMPLVAIHDDSEDEPSEDYYDDGAAPTSLTASEPDAWSSLALTEVRDRDLALAHVQALAFEAECDIDPQLLSTLEVEIAVSDAEDGALDEQYTTRLSQMLRDARWHYIVSVERNGDSEQEYVVVQTTYALSQLAGGIVHDLQSGAWMDADLFENILGAYGAANT